LVRRVAVVALCFASVSASRAQTYYWSAFAGLPPQLGSADGPAADARFNRPAGVVSDAAGNVYVADAFNHTIRHISAAGVVSTLAGSPGQPGGVVGIGPEARFANPTGLVLANGALFVTDRGNNAIRRVTSTGAATLFAGGTFAPGHADGVGAAARFNDPYALAADAAGDLYVTERGNHTVRKIARDGTVTTLAGSPGVPGSQDGPGAAARFRNPSGITLDLAGAIYIADSGNHTLRRIAADGAVTTFAGSPGVSGTANGTGAAARFSFPRGVIAFGDGTLAVVDNSNHAIRFVSPAAVVSPPAARPTPTSTAPPAPPASTIRTASLSPRIAPSISASSSATPSACCGPTARSSPSPAPRVCPAPPMPPAPPRGSRFPRASRSIAPATSTSPTR
jgi:hypothetical protein